MPKHEYRVMLRSYTANGGWCWERHSTHGKLNHAFAEARIMAHMYGRDVLVVKWAPTGKPRRVKPPRHLFQETVCKKR